MFQKLNIGNTINIKYYDEVNDMIISLTSVILSIKRRKTPKSSLTPNREMIIFGLEHNNLLRYLKNSNLFDSDWIIKKFDTGNCYNVRKLEVVL